MLGVRCFVALQCLILKFQNEAILIKYNIATLVKRLVRNLIKYETLLVSACVSPNPTFGRWPWSLLGVYSWIGRIRPSLYGMTSRIGPSFGGGTD